MEWLRKNFGILITILGWAFSLGFCYNNINQLEKEINSIKTRQTSFEMTINDMNKTITSIDTKMNLLLDNKLIVKGE